MTISATAARAKLFRLIEQTSETHEPVQIVGRRGNAVLIAEEDWQAIQATLHLLSIPGMRASIRTGLKTPVSRCADKPGW